MIYQIEVPRLNANEDEVVVVDVAIEVGQTVSEGDLVAVVESTKAATEISSERSGTVKALHVKLGQFIGVGKLIAEIEDDAPSTGPVPKADDARMSGEIQISAKARKRAQELGVDIDAVTPTNGRVLLKDVEAAARPFQPVAPATGNFSAVIIGGGGHASYVVDTIISLGAQTIGCLDASLPNGTEVLHDVEIIGTDERLAEIRADGTKIAFIGLGGTVDNAPRRKLFDLAISKKFDVPPLVHRDATITTGVNFAAGVQVLAGATIGPRTKIDANTIINQGANICHDVHIGMDVHITPSAIVAADVKIGDGTTLGMGATVLNGASIGKGCLIHNGVSIVSDVPDFTEVDRRGQRRRLA